MEIKEKIIIVTGGTGQLGRVIVKYLANAGHKIYVPAKNLEKFNKVFDNLNSKVIIDLKGVEYIDSSGFGCLLSIMRVAKNNYGILKITNPEPEVKSLFQILHLHTVFEIFHDADECIRSFR